ncbi:MAG: hypothetical protein AAGC43_17705, partial [Bacteroidota bacterium]
FFFQKRQIAQLFIRRQDRVFVWQTHAEEKAKSCMFHWKDENSVLVLLDPAESKQGGAKFADGMRRLIYAASNNDAHFASAAAKVNGVESKRYFGRYTTEELYIALKVMNGNIDKAKVDEKIQKVGLLPRYLHDERFFNHRMKQRKAALGYLAQDRTNLNTYYAQEGMSTQNDSAPGTILMISASRATRPKDSADKNTSVAMLKGDDDDDDEEEDQTIEVGYDGETGIDYEQPELSIISPFVLNELIKNDRANIISFWGKVDSAAVAGMGKCFEELFWNDLKNSRFQATRWKLASSSMNVERSVLTFDLAKGNYVENCNDIKCVLTDDDNSDNNRRVYRMEEGFPAIDFAGPGLKVYQVTVSDKHTMSPAGMENILLKLGFLTKTNETYKVSKKNNLKLEFYWVVPEGIENKWKKKAPFKYHRPNTNLKRALNDCLAKRVIQYALIITSGSSQT